MHPPLVPLNQATDKHQVGGKAAALGQLLQAGFRVPAGFVVLPDIIDEVAILAAFDRLHAPLVAVRSSSVQEDSEAASWAGQLETFLNVSRDNVVARVRDCVASTSSARARAYGQQAGSAGATAVIIQTMVQSDVSGVAFSVHPVTKSADQIVIEAVLGLGEALVSGELTPDNYIVNKATGQIMTRTLVTQNKQLMLGKSGTTWQALHPPVSSQKLDDEVVQQLAQTVIQLEKLYSIPVDIEWAWTGQHLYVLQCRPITTLH